MRLPRFFRRFKFFERRWIPPPDERLEHDAAVRGRLRSQTPGPGSPRPTEDREADGEAPPDSA